MPNATRIERKGITELTKVLMKSRFIKADFDTNDKTESWDGFIYLYRDKNWKKETLAGRIPVQIKSTEQLFDDATASIPISTADLRNYCAEGGVVLFLISLNTLTDTSYIFYVSLLKERVSTILSMKHNQKKVTISLQRFPEDQPDEMERIFYSFLSECKLNESGFVSETGDLLNCLDSDLKKYILQKFEWYQDQDIAVQTPQLLLMLLTYPNDNIIKSIFNVYKTKDGNSYGTYLEKFFRNIDLHYKDIGRTYRERNWTAFLQVLKNAEKFLQGQKDKTRITINILCYAILSNGDSTTAEMIQCQMGKIEFQRILRFILNDTLPSVAIDPNLRPYVVNCWR